MNKHTPGPWAEKLITYAIADTGDYDGSIDIIGPDGKPLAFIQGYEDKDEANARLIATAPDLLAALETIIKGVFPDMDSKDCQHLRGVANKAIAKAKGEA